MVKFVSLKEIKPLRHKVLWPHILKEEDCELEVDQKPSTFHAAYLEHNNIKSIATFCKEQNNKFENKKQYRLRAMATSPNSEGKGYATHILTFAFTILKERNCELLWCDARERATGFYEKLGFTKKGNIYEIPKIGPHYLMFINLTD